MAGPDRLVLSVEVDPRLLEAIVVFTGEVAEVAATLTNLGLSDEAARLLDALDRLDAVPGRGDNGDLPTEGGP